MKLKQGHFRPAVQDWPSLDNIVRPALGRGGLDNIFTVN